MSWFDARGNFQDMRVSAGSQPFWWPQFWNLPSFSDLFSIFMILKYKIVTIFTIYCLQFWHFSNVNIFAISANIIFIETFEASLRSITFPKTSPKLKTNSRIKWWTVTYSWKNLGIKSLEIRSRLFVSQFAN